MKEIDQFSLSSLYKPDSTVSFAQLIKNRRISRSQLFYKWTPDVSVISVKSFLQKAELDQADE